ncbi:hypothetical protein D029_4833B, partial [Vibrio parahaemolyticus 970107]
YYFSYVTHE